jgi:hypothetical protein
MSDPILAGLIALLGFAVGVWLHSYMTPFRRMRLRRRSRCLFGKHDAGPVRDVVGGRRVQRCDWCDKVVREYQVTVNEAKQATIRRIY